MPRSEVRRPSYDDDDADDIDPSDLTAPITDWD
jgi:hypothetical protein